MNRAAVFALVAAGAAVGAVAGTLAVDKKKGGRRIKQQPYAAIGSGLLATGVAAVVYNNTTCPPCVAGAAPTAVPSSLGLGGFSAAVAASSILGGIAGAMAVGKNKGARLAQQVYAPIGAAVIGASAAAVFMPDPTKCAPCATLPSTPTPTPAPAPTPTPATPPVQLTNTLPNGSPEPR